MLPKNNNKYIYYKNKKIYLHYMYFLNDDTLIIFF